MSQILYPLTFEPLLLEKVWGGTRLRSEWGKGTSDAPIGESWEVSAVTGTESVVDSGAHAGKKLSDLVK